MNKRPIFYRRDGTPCPDEMEWAKQFSRDHAQKRVRETILSNGLWVSTVWIGIDHAFNNGPPMIFETMVFPSKERLGEDLDMERYATEAEAIDGHRRMVEKWKTHETIV
jgi:hypothetical protein